MSFTSGQTVRDFAIVTLSKRLVRQSTSDSYMQTIRHLGMDDVPMEKVTIQFLHQRLLTITNLNTKRKHAVALRALFRDVLPDIKELKIPRSIPRVYELPDEKTIRETIMASPYGFYGLLMMYAGMRAGEACAIHPKDVTGNVLRIHKQRTEQGELVLSKTQGEVVIPLWLAALIKEHKPQVVTPGAIRESFRRYGIKAGIHLSPHMLRHWYATVMVQKKVNPEIARQQMRHSDLKTTLGYYAQVQKQDIDNAVNELFEKALEAVDLEDPETLPLETQEKEKPAKKTKKAKKKQKNGKSKKELEALFNEWLKSQDL